MVLEYLTKFARTKSPSFVGKYTSTMEHIYIYIIILTGAYSREWMGMDGNGWEWIGMDGNGWEWMGMGEWDYH